jgi:glycosyltransferase involved in cell wall biosynthesis
MTRQRHLLSIVVPAFNEEAVITETAKRLVKLVDRMSAAVDVEVVFVDDGSRDQTLALLREFAAQHPQIKVVALSRNFGHQVALTAGLDTADGDYVAVIDADLQDPPELIEDMYRMAAGGGVDVVYGRRRSRAGETAFKKATAAAFYRFLNYVCDVEIPADTGDFRVMSRRVVDAFKQLKERHRFVRGMVPWLGYRAAPFDYDRASRFAGESKYSVGHSVRFAADAIWSFSRKPLAVATRLGAAIIAAGLAGAAVALYLKLFSSTYQPSGITAIFLAVVIFSGVQILLIGVVGSYIGRIFDEVRGRPLYLVAETINVSRAHPRGEVIAGRF